MNRSRALSLSLSSSLAAVLAAQDPSVPSAPATPRVSPMLLPQILVLPRGAHELVIDGSLVDWPELPAVRMDDTRQVSGTAFGAYHGPGDIGALAFFLWDADALYCSVAVKDDWHRALDAATVQLTEIPVADSILLSFDPDRNTRSNGPDPGRQEDRSFWLADQAGRDLVLWDRLRGTARSLDQAVARVVVLHDKEQGITSYEARIPWSEILPIGRKPAAGATIDVQIVVNDFDETTDSMPQTRVGLVFGCSPIVDPGLHASMMLVADEKVLQGIMPTFPPKPTVTEPPAPPAAHWQDLTARLLQYPPAVYDGSTSPADCGGSRRLAVLEEIDAHCERFPRVDVLEYHQRVHRRMAREVAGLQARGLLAWWSERLRSVSKNAEDPVPEHSVRVFRLPAGGWLVRSSSRNFVIDAAGADLAGWIWGGTEFCVLTQPLDIVRRNDQLLIRMLSSEPPRAVFTHIAFHLPMVAMDRIPLAELGKSYGQPSGTQVHALGKAQSDGLVPWSCSYRLELPDGPRLVLVGPTLKVAEIEAQDTDVLILSPHNTEGPAIVAKIQPRLVLIDDVFLGPSRADFPRLSLRDLHALQQAMRPVPSLILAPGESWTVTAGK